MEKQQCHQFTYYSYEPMNVNLIFIGVLIGAVDREQ
jgi:hypothetical protein